MMMDRINHWVDKLLQDSGMAISAVPYIRLFILLALLLLVAFLLHTLTRKFVIRAIYGIFKRTAVKWDDTLIEHRSLDKLAHLAPAIVIRLFAELIFRDFPLALPAVIRITDCYLIIAGMLIVLSFLKVAEYTLQSSKTFADKPIASYFQLIRIILYITTTILVLSVLIARSPVYFLSAFGAMTAILLLIFKDTILGLVASVQISANDMVRVGDWVEMPKFNADGDVIAINLNTVKICNWDKTISNVPTFHFISDSFKNWRGMKESGGRRIKRRIYINIRTIKFVDPEMRERFKKYFLIKDFVQQKQDEIDQHNAANNFDSSVLINGRRMTNVGVFRRYTENYLRNHSGINQKMTMLVRQTEFEDRGLPIEIYCFTASTAWATYETVQSDIFDHLLAALSFFDLEVFQQPSGSDLSNMLSQQN